jgi:hypothetical protein
MCKRVINNTRESIYIFWQPYLPIIINQMLIWPTDVSCTHTSRGGKNWFPGMVDFSLVYLSLSWRLGLDL